MRTLVSVIICTHNPRPDYLRQTLDGLRGQRMPLEDWELLLIDNASREPLSKTCDLSWHPRARHVRENKLGLTPARVRGISEACGHLLVFSDDDNVLPPDFLERAVAIPSRHPQLGVFGAGVLEPVFEVPPPAELVSRLRLLALRSEPAVLWSNNIDDFKAIPWGAGLCVTRRIAQMYPEYVEHFSASGIVDRKGQQLFSGGDDLFSWASVAAGQGFGVFPELRLLHLISAQRLNQAYFLRLIHDHRFSHAVLRFVLAGLFPPRRIILDRYVHLLLHGVRKGLFSMRCQWAEVRAETRAASFIAKSGLHPLSKLSGSTLERVGHRAGHSGVDGTRVQEASLTPELRL